MTQSQSSIPLVLTALLLLAGVGIVASQGSAWAAARASDSDDMLLAATGGILLTTAGVAAFAGATFDLPTRRVAILGASGYVAGVPIAVLVTTLVTQTWEPLIGAGASAILVAATVRAATIGENQH